MLLSCAVADKNETTVMIDKEQLKWDWYEDEYYTERYKDKEDYANQICSISTYAVITSDGVWHSKGEMGWWACGSETSEESREWNLSFYDKFIRPYNDEKLFEYLNNLVKEGNSKEIKTNFNFIFYLSYSYTLYYMFFDCSLF